MSSCWAAAAKCTVRERLAAEGDDPEGEERWPVDDASAEGVEEEEGAERLWARGSEVDAGGSIASSRIESAAFIRH